MRKVEQGLWCLSSSPVTPAVPAKRFFHLKCWASYVVCLAQIERRLWVCNSGLMHCHDMAWPASCFDSEGPLLLCDAVGKYSFCLTDKPLWHYADSLTVALGWLQTKTSPDNVVGLAVQRTHTKYIQQVHTHSLLMIGQKPGFRVLKNKPAKVQLIHSKLSHD